MTENCQFELLIMAEQLFFLLHIFALNAYFSRISPRGAGPARGHGTGRVSSAGTSGPRSPVCPSGPARVSGTPGRPSP